MKRDLRESIFRRCAAVTAAAFAFASTGCDTDRPPSGDECERLARHIVDLRLASMDLVADPRIAERHRTQLLQAAGEGMVGRCEAELDRDQVDCVLAATSMVGASACMRPSTAERTGGASHD